MKKQLLTTTLLSLGILFTTTLPLDAKTYRIDPAHSSVEFSVRHLGLSKVKGKFEKFDGRIDWEKDLQKSRIAGRVRIDTINTGIAKRDKHLKSADFFNIKANNEIKFESTKITQDKNGNYQIEGTLTIKDVTKTIKAPLELTGPIKGPRGKTRYAFETNFTINRFDYNIAWNNTLKDNTLVVAKNVEIEINIQAIEN